MVRCLSNASRTWCRLLWPWAQMTRRGRRLRSRRRSNGKPATSSQSPWTAQSPWQPVETSVSKDKQKKCLLKVSDVSNVHLLHYIILLSSCKIISYLQNICVNDYAKTNSSCIKFTNFDIIRVYNFFHLLFDDPQMPVSFSCDWSWKPNIFDAFSLHFSSNFFQIITYLLAYSYMAVSVWMIKDKI